VVLRLLAALGLLALLASVIFSLHRAGHFRAWLAGTADPKPREIVFDNGSVRDLAAPAAPGASAPATKLTELSPPGVMRKCVRGDRVTYSNLTCPAGFRERPIKAEPVTVVPAVRVPATPPAAAPPGQAPGPNNPRSLRDALDLKPDEQLRQRMIDRAVEAEAKR
jgi:hypothetical protein